MQKIFFNIGEGHNRIGGRFSLGPAFGTPTAPRWSTPSSVSNCSTYCTIKNWHSTLTDYGTR